MAVAIYFLQLIYKKQKTKKLGGLSSIVFDFLYIFKFPFSLLVRFWWRETLVTSVSIIFFYLGVVSNLVGVEIRDETLRKVFCKCYLAIKTIQICYILFPSP